MSWRGSDGEREILGRKRGESWEQIERGRGKCGQRDGRDKTMIWKWETWMISQIQCQLMWAQHVNCVSLCLRACICERDKITLECKADTDHLLPDRGAGGCLGLRDDWGRHYYPLVWKHVQILPAKAPCTKPFLSLWWWISRLAKYQSPAVTHTQRYSCGVHHSISRSKQTSNGFFLYAGLCISVAPVYPVY